METGCTGKDGKVRSGKIKGGFADAMRRLQQFSIYGDGTCDNKATITIKGITIPITL